MQVKYTEPINLAIPIMLCKPCVPILKAIPPKAPIGAKRIMTFIILNSTFEILSKAFKTTVPSPPNLFKP
ncbi:hypothetical protein D3C73_1595980 [compost metagenome]